jgi:hypothetical protein
MGNLCVDGFGVRRGMAAPRGAPRATADPQPGAPAYSLNGIRPLMTSASHSLSSGQSVAQVPKSAMC